MSRRVVAVAVAVTVVVAMAGVGVQSSRAFEARAGAAAAALERLREAGVGGATVDGLALRLRSIRDERWGPVPRSWLPAPLTGQDARLRALLAAIDRSERDALATARGDAEAALRQLAAADPGLPAADLGADRARIDGASTPAQLRQFTRELLEASATAARQRQPALDLEPKVAGLRQLMARAAELRIDTGPAAAAIAAYEALVAMPARQVGDEVAPVSTLLGKAEQSLSASIQQAEQSGQPPPPAPVQQGRSVVIDLGDQHLYAYQDGALFISTPVTTGRPELPTEQGTFHVIFKRSPYQFISPWPRSSPFYYPPAWTSWAVEFIGDGTFLHDAPWQPEGTYGTGSQNGPYASHGCVHVPKAVMPDLYGWLQPGDTVVVQP